MRPGMGAAAYPRLQIGHTLQVCRFIAVMSTKRASHSGMLTGQERCGLPVTVRLRASMRYKTFHGLEPLAGGALEWEHSSAGRDGAPAQLPDMRTHR